MSEETIPVEKIRELADYFEQKALTVDDPVVADAYEHARHMTAAYLPSELLPCACGTNLPPEDCKYRRIWCRICGAETPFMNTRDWHRYVTAWNAMQKAARE